MSNIATIYQRELKHYFTSPIAYIFMILLLGIMSFTFFFFFQYFAYIRDANMRLYFQTMPWFFAIFTAAISMRLWSEEQKLGTLELLFTMPVKSIEIVLGKYLAGLTILVITLFLTFSIPITIAYVGDPDWGKIFTGYIGVFFAGALLLALGSFISALTDNQTVSLLVTSVLAVLLIGMGVDRVVLGINDFFSGIGIDDAGAFFAYFSILKHTDGMVRGILDLRDVIYFLSVTGLLIMLNFVAVEKRKY